MKFGAKLKYIRQQKDWSQEEMANFLGTSKQVISRYENGQTTPKIDIVLNYAKKLNVSLEALIDNEKDYRHLQQKRQPVTNAELSLEEETVLELFRSLPDDKKEIAIQMIKVVLSVK